MVVSESELSLMLRILKLKVIVLSREMRGGKPSFFCQNSWETMQYDFRRAIRKKAKIIVHKEMTEKAQKSIMK